MGGAPHAGPPRRGQSYAGTDRQCRGRLLDVLRALQGSERVTVEISGGVADVSGYTDYGRVWLEFLLATPVESM